MQRGVDLATQIMGGGNGDNLKLKQNKKNNLSLIIVILFFSPKIMSHRS